jgi:hypothetical protein
LIATTALVLLWIALLTCAKAPYPIFNPIWNSLMPKGCSSDMQRLLRISSQKACICSSVQVSIEVLIFLRGSCRDYGTFFTSVFEAGATSEFLVFLENRISVTFFTSLSDCFSCLGKSCPEEFMAGSVSAYICTIDDVVASPLLTTF